MKSPQSPHSSSLWVFALSLRVLLLAPHSESISHLDAKLSSTVLLLVGLRVISYLHLSKPTLWVYTWYMTPSENWTGHGQFQLDEIRAIQLVIKISNVIRCEQAAAISKSALPCTGLYKAVQSHRHHRKVPTIAELHSMVLTCTYCTAFTELPVQCFTDYTT